MNDVIPLPEWVLRHASPQFVQLARVCGVCAWAVIVMSATCAALVGWKLTRGPALARTLQRPSIATSERARLGVVWIVAVVIASWLMGLTGLVPLLGDAVFLAFAGMVCLEWYAWWTWPEWVGKLTELIVIALLYWLAWLVAAKLPPALHWPVVVASFSLMTLVLVHGFFGSNVRLVLVILAPIGLVLLLLPYEVVPILSFPVVWLAIALSLSWATAPIGALWLRLPRWIADLVAPVWFAVSALLAHFGVPHIRE